MPQRSAIVLGTGPSLTEALPLIAQLHAQGVMVFGVNNTFQDCPLDCWIACDPSWHEVFSPVPGDFDKWHWDKTICKRYGYRYIEGRWFDGTRWVLDENKPDNPIGQLSTDEKWIAYNHCSSAQALNLAAHYGCDPIGLAGHDFAYPRGENRHYFAGLSETPGEYPAGMRKYSTFDGLIETYRQISQQPGLPRIVNCTPGSKLPWFPFADLETLQ